MTKQCHLALTFGQGKCVVIVAQQHSAFFFLQLDKGILVSQQGIQVFLGQMVDIAIVAGVENRFFRGCAFLGHELTGGNAQGGVQHRRIGHRRTRHDSRECQDCGKHRCESSQQVLLFQLSSPP